MLRIVPYLAEEHEPLLPALTTLLHAAYAELAKKGLRFWASHQPVNVTRERLQEGAAWLFFVGDELAGTISLGEGIKKKEPAEYYQRPGVFYFTQFAFHPKFQGRGFGRQVLAFVEKAALERGGTELALDTSERAFELLAMYQRWGFSPVSKTTWTGVNYQSVILSKRLASS